MHHRARDITGLRVGHLTALRYHGSNGRRSLWDVACVSCGKTLVLAASELLKQKQKGIEASCGCMRQATVSRRNTKHGLSTHPGYAVYRSMLARCNNPKHQAWANYGGRGITVCDRWQESFENFWLDMSDGYAQGLTIERKKNDRGYSKANCAWVTSKAQANNTRANRKLHTSKGVMTIATAAEEFGIKYTTLLYRIDNGWSVDRALSVRPDFRNRGFST
jgi:hypothetical protein